MIRTTVRLPEALLEAAQRRARETRRSFTELLADALRYELERATSSNRVCEPLPTYGGNGLQPAVVVSDSSALEELMNEH
jgi:hypothetical protein